MRWVPARVLIPAALMSLLLAACIETLSTPQISASGATSGRADAAGQIHARLRNQCVNDAGGVFGPNEQVSKQCECFASAMTKSMDKDDLEFFAQYRVVPTLNTAEPKDVRKRCGMTVAAGAGPKASLPPAEVQ